MGSGASVAAGFAIFIAFVAIVLVLLLGYQERYRPTTIIYAIQTGSTGTTDTFTPSTNVYVVNQGITTPFSLTLAGDNSFTQGRSIYIKNASTQTVTLVPSAGLAINTGSLQNGLTITPGSTAWLLFTAPNVALRMF